MNFDYDDDDFRLFDNKDMSYEKMYEIIKKIDALDKKVSKIKNDLLFDEIDDTVSALESIIEDKLALEVISKLKSQILKLRETEV